MREPPPVPEDEQLLYWECLDCEQTWLDGRVEERVSSELRRCEHVDMQRLSLCCGNSIDPDTGFCTCGEYA